MLTSAKFRCEVLVEVPASVEGADCLSHLTYT